MTNSLKDAAEIAARLHRLSGLTDNQIASLSLTLDPVQVDQVSDSVLALLANGTLPTLPLNPAGGLPLGLPGAVQPSRFVGATASGPPTTGTFAVGDFVIVQSGGISICTTAGSPGTWQAPGNGTSVPTTVVHGSTASTARPASATPITWIGTVAPTNATSNDLWIDESVVAGTGSAALPMLQAWVLTEAWRVVSGTRNLNGALTAATVAWPDGGTGSYTADTVSTAFPGLVDAYHITYVPPGGGATQTFTQTAMTRGPNGGVTAQPVLAVS